MHRLLSQGLAERTEQSAEFAVRHLALKTLQRILAPISMLLGVVAGRALLAHQGMPVGLLDLAVPLLVSLATIRTVVYFLRKTFRPSPMVKARESLISTSDWILVAQQCLKGWTAWPCKWGGADFVAGDGGVVDAGAVGGASD